MLGIIFRPQSTIFKHETHFIFLSSVGESERIYAAAEGTFLFQYITRHPFFCSNYCSLTVIFIYLSMDLQPFVGPWPLLQFLDFYTVSRTLDKGSAHRKATTYTQDCTNTE
jgi:hypothetical protein